MLLTVALIWGASFMFIKIADRQLNPATLIAGRLGSAAIALAAVAAASHGVRRTLTELRAAWRWLAVVALVNTALPFWLLAWGETRIDSGLVSIVQGAVPIFNALIAFVFFREVRVTGLRLLGLAVGFVGVVVLVGAQPHGKVLGALAVVGMALGYATGGLLAGRHLRETPALVVTLASCGIAFIVALPAAVVQAPDHVPSGETIAAVLALGVPGTALAYLLFYALILRAGASYAALVTYLIPPIALAYGVVFLKETFGAVAFAALALILGGVALATGSRLPFFTRRGLASEP
jgi:drug/metabolite transporter (DMT)-like permease